jgi:hypothetical protein
MSSDTTRTCHDPSRPRRYATVVVTVFAVERIEGTPPGRRWAEEV